jgi:hypothetical protein
MMATFFTALWERFFHDEGTLSLTPLYEDWQVFPLLQMGSFPPPSYD